MALDPPSEVVQFLQFIGIDWPAVNEDSVREFATHIRDFANNISSAHQDATATVKQIGDSYTGAAYDAMSARWASVSTTHVNELVEACHVVATALDAAADVIVAMKGVAIAELVVMAVTFVADQAAAVLTFGIAEAAEALVIKAGEEAVNFLEQQIEQYIIGEVIEAAIKPLTAKVSSAVQGLMYPESSAAPGGSISGAGSSFSIEPQTVQAHAATFQQHADTVRTHTQTLLTNLSGVNFA